MDAKTYATVYPKEFLRKFLDASCRPDGRGLTAVRKTVITTGSLKNADGSSLVKVGNTTIMCGLKLEVATEKETAVAEYITNVAEEGNVLPRNQLCIQEGKSCWVIYADLYCLDFDGNIEDVAVIALVTALLNLQLPETKVAQDGEVMITGNKGGKVTVNAVVPLSLGFMDDYLLVDPTAAEEEFIPSLLTVVMNSNEEIISFYKPGGKGLTLEQTKAVLALGKDRLKVVLPILQQHK